MESGARLPTNFPGLLLWHRLQAGLTQEALAERATLSPRTLGDLERGKRRPRAPTVALLADALHLAESEARALHAAASGYPASMVEASAPIGTGPSRLDNAARAAGLAPDGNPAGHAPTVLRESGVQLDSALPMWDGATASAGLGVGCRADWGDAPDVSTFKGRHDDLETLGNWVRAEHCRVIALLGLGGLGKTMLAAQLARFLASDVNCIFWRSLRNAMPLSQWLEEAIRFLSAPQQLPMPGSLDGRLTLLRTLLREQRCLLVLDNWETVLAPDQPDGVYRPGYEEYGRLLDMLGRVAYQSCVVISSREMPPELVPLEGEDGPVRALYLRGLDAQEGRAILHDKKLQGDAAAWQTLVTRCGGNALVLRVVGATISDLFAGDMHAFLAAGEVITGNIRRVLDEQAARLSAAERALFVWLAVAREPCGFSDLAAHLAARVTRCRMQSALAALRRRSLIERGERAGTFSLQPVVLEYVTDYLVETICAEIVHGRPLLLTQHALLLAQARDYVRQTQERLILAPILKQLAQQHPDGQSGAADLLLALLAHWRGRPHDEQGYGPGNVVNLLRLLRGHLRGLDISHLAIRHAYLQEVEAQDTDMTHTHLAACTLAESFDTIYALALSADGQLLVAGTNSGEIKVWRTADHLPLFTVQAHQGFILGLALRQDGCLVASAGVDGTIKLWDLLQGKCQIILRGHHGTVNGLAIGADGKILASAGHDGTVRLWNLNNGACLHILQSHQGWAYMVAFSTDGQRVASSGEDGTLRVWDVASGACLQVLSGHDGASYGVALGSDGRLVSSGLDGTIRLWNLPSGQCHTILRGHHGPIYTLALATESRLVASSGQDRTIRLWDTESGLCFDILEGHRAPVWAVCLAKNGDLAASSSQDGMLRLWDLAKRQPLALLQGRASQLYGVALDRAGIVVAAAGPDHAVRLWDRASGQLLVTLHAAHGLTMAVALSDDGCLVAGGGDDGAIHIWKRPALHAAELAAHRGYVRALAFSGDGQTLVSGGQDGTVRIWKADPDGCWNLLSVLEGHEGIVYGVAISADGSLVASGADDGTVRLWDVLLARPRAVLRGHTALVRNVALSRQGGIVASASRDGTVRIWHTSTGQSLATLEHSEPVHGVALSADGRRVASASHDGMVRIWSLESSPATTHCLAILPCAGRLPDYVALNAAGEIVAATGGDGAVELWNVRSGPRLHTLWPNRPYERLRIGGLTGITAAQHTTLLALGALEEEIHQEER